MKGSGLSHGACTIINAMATGKGAAFGVDLKTWAEVELTPGTGIETSIQGFPGEDDTLIRLCVRRTIDRFSPRTDYHVKVTTRSEIPISRGLKSSSSAANAVIAATLDALGQEADLMEAVRMGAGCAIDAGVSVTGAFDDACASYFGGVVFTDNQERKVLRRMPFPEGYRILLHIPDFQIRKATLPLERIRGLRDIVQLAFDRGFEGDIFRGLTINGLCYSAALGLDQTVAISALQHGAVAAGLSGSGPAITVVVREKEADDFISKLPEVKFISVDIYNGEGGN
jgi:shikimate kinase